MYEAHLAELTGQTQEHGKPRRKWRGPEARGSTSRAINKHPEKSKGLGGSRRMKCQHSMMPKPHEQRTITGGEEGVRGGVLPSFCVHSTVNKKLPAFSSLKCQGGKDICSLWWIKTSLGPSWGEQGSRTHMPVPRECRCQESAGAKRAPLPICQTLGGTCLPREEAKSSPHPGWHSWTEMNSGKEFVDKSLKVSKQSGCWGLPFIKQSVGLNNVLHEAGAR